ncbi:MAG: hypothetical protein L0Y56_02370 [Nitrospira sp.]|nr:hypothetical protein [Nitrospira sp.]
MSFKQVSKRTKEEVEREYHQGIVVSLLQLVEERGSVVISEAEQSAFLAVGRFQSEIQEAGYIIYKGKGNLPFFSISLPSGNNEAISAR